jgi:glycosyltransferase involved in cell wall biosynthesis
MRIAIIADSLDRQNAGVHVFTRSLVDELVSRDDGNEYILLRQRHDDALPDKVKQIVIPSYKILLGYASIRLFLIIPFILRKYSIDIVFEPAHFGPLNLPKRIKRATFIHDLTPIIYPQHHQWFSQAMQNLFLKRILARTDHVFTNSANTSKDLIKYYPITKNKNTFIHLGRDRTFVPSHDISKIKRLGITSPYFLCVGTIEPRKNLEMVLDAFQSYIDDTNENVELVLVGGKGWKSEAFDSKLKTFKYKTKVKRLGFVDKPLLPLLYSHSIALLYLSLYEGFGFPVLEAMSCGIPVICSHNSSIPEVGGEWGHYVDPTSMEDVVVKMKTVANYNEDERAKLGERSIEHAQKFSWKKFADLFLLKLGEIKEG